MHGATRNVFIGYDTAIINRNIGNIHLLSKFWRSSKKMQGYQILSDNETLTLKTKKLIWNNTEKLHWNEEGCEKLDES